ncbi:MAG: acyl-CoA dehydrogenase family protein [Nocardioides sp.]|uniref:acyl-CoA dehydrogenase family protein n=1 Tax=Nocardioides sp. TaxID=35761 RepID=UPI0039E6F6F0
MNDTTPDLVALRHEVRDFLAERLASGAITVTADSWLAGWDEEFSKELARRGWIGMTIPVEFGGRGRSFVERFVVTEELLAVGAPVSAHWISDRQIAPSLLRYGSQEQKERFLPRIARGECYFAIGMSEPDAGSDLAAVRTRATRVEGGWRLDGSKVWTSNAHRAHAFIALVRTTPVEESGRHQGLTQLIVHLDAPGVTIRPIESQDGQSHFNEVFFDGVHVPDADVLGEVGAGWRQVTSELGFERSGPERFLSTFPALARLVEASRAAGGSTDLRIGRSLNRLAGLHALSGQVSAMLAQGGPAEVTACLVKTLGTLHEGDIADLVDEHAVAGPAAGDPALGELADLSLLRRPGFTLRGGTNEILRGIIASSLGAGVMVDFPVDRDYATMADAVLADCTAGLGSGQVAAFDRAHWAKLDELGLVRLTGTEAAGGSGAGWHEAATLHRLAGYHGVALPLVEHDLLAGWLLERLDLKLDDRVTSLGVAEAGAVTVAYGRHADRVLVLSRRGADWTLTDLDGRDLSWQEAENLAHEPRDLLRAEPSTASAAGTPVPDDLIEELGLRGALARATQLCGALDRSVELATEHASVRIQFGRPLLRFQAVQALLADSAAEAALAQAAALAAVRAMADPDTGQAERRRAVTVAKSCASHAAGVVCRNAHQVLGAIGYTSEHALHRSTGRLLAWRREYGTRDEWDGRQLAAVMAAPPGAAWSAVVGV